MKELNNFFDIDDEDYVLDRDFNYKKIFYESNLKIGLLTLNISTTLESLKELKRLDEEGFGYLVNEMFEITFVNTIKCEIKQLECRLRSFKNTTRNEKNIQLKWNARKEKRKLQKLYKQENLIKDSKKRRI